MARVLRTITDFLKGDDNISPNRAIILPNGTNRLFLGELAAPPAGAYRDVSAVGQVAVNPVVGDVWLRQDSGASVNPQRRAYIAVTGGGSPAWEPYVGPFHQAANLGVTGTVTPDLNVGNAFLIPGATGDVTIANPTNSNPMDLLWIALLQDATGGRRILWGANFGTVWQPNPAPNSVSSIWFVRGASGTWSPLGYSPPGIANPQITPVTVAAAVATDQNLMSYALPAGFLNGVRRCLRVKGAGVYSTQVTLPTVTIKVKLGALTLLTWTTATVASQAAGDGWLFSADLIVTVAGASGTLESHGTLAIDLGALTAASTVYSDNNAAVSGTIDLTAAQTLQITVAYSNSSTSNSCTERELTTELLNAA